MRVRCLMMLLLVGFLGGCGTGAGSGFAFDGGQSGTGISTIQGNVASTPNMDLSGVLVTLREFGASATTDATGAFLIEGHISGAATVDFELPSEEASAEARVLVPRGGRVQLLDVVLLRNAPQVIEEYEVEFEGVIETIDCAGATLSIACREECDDNLLFTVNLMGSEVRDGQGQPISCDALTVGTFVEIEATADAEGHLIAAYVTVEEEDDGGSENDEPGPDDSGDDDAGEDDSGEGDGGEDDSGEGDDRAKEKFKDNVQ